ncbi:MAG: pyruvate synthase subunit PorD [Euryarchaeota archaeon]|nr:pyruvate synthase subunit PorD [Euryarchaeota archaeon]
MRELTIGAVIKKPGSSRRNKTGTWRNLKPVIDIDKCLQCDNCQLFCPEGIIKKAKKGMEIDYDYCKGCGICANECPTRAIQMVKEGID